METPNIQLYNFLRYDFHLTDIKSLEFMHILDKEYKSGIKDDLTTLEKKMDEGFLRVDQKMDEGFLRADQKMNEGFLRLDQKMDEGFIRADRKMDEGFLRVDQKMNEGFLRVDQGFQEMKSELRAFGKQLDDVGKHIIRLDNRIDLSTKSLQIEIRDSKIETIRWVGGCIFLAVALMILATYLKK